jgi:hypothetical protein
MQMLLGLCSSDDGAARFMEGRDGSVWVAHSGERDSAPYRSMFALATDDIAGATEAANMGLHVIFRRVIKPSGAVVPPERVIASFGMVRHPDLEHAESDAHWRDQHGPLALASHTAMCDYEQLSILATLQGTPLDGVAMCAFPDRSTLSTDFFNDDDAKAAIIADVASFADTRASLPRVVLTQSH